MGSNLIFLFNPIYYLKQILVKNKIYKKKKKLNRLHCFKIFAFNKIYVSIWAHMCNRERVVCIFAHILMFVWTYLLV